MGLLHAKRKEKESKFWDYLDTKGKIKLSSAWLFIYSSVFMIVPLISSKSHSLTFNILFALAFGTLVTTVTILKLLRAHILSVVLFIIFLFIAIKIRNISIIHVDIDTLRYNYQILAMICYFGVIVGGSLFYSLIFSEGEKTIKMKTTLELAEEIHNTLVPAIAQTTEKLNIFGLSESIESMGGDLIDYISLDGQRTVYIADVSGHGVSAGIVMSMFKGAMRTMAQEKQTIDKLFTRVNHALTPIKKKNMFLTAAGITFDDHSSTAMISSAGHLPVLHFSKKTEGFYRHHVKQIPLGVSDTTLYEGLNVPFDQGDYFVLLTDGLTENKNNFDNLAMLTTIEDCLVPKLKKDMPLDIVSQELFADMKKQGEPIDDRSIIIIKCL